MCRDIEVRSVEVIRWDSLALEYLVIHFKKVKYRSWCLPASRWGAASIRHGIAVHRLHRPKARHTTVRQSSSSSGVEGRSSLCWSEARGIKRLDGGRRLSGQRSRSTPLCYTGVLRRLLMDAGRGLPCLFCVHLMSQHGLGWKRNIRRWLSGEHGLRQRVRKRLCRHARTTSTMHAVVRRAERGTLGLRRHLPL